MVLTAMNNELNNAIEQIEDQHRYALELAYQECASLRQERDHLVEQKTSLEIEFSDPLRLKVERDALKDDNESLLSMLRDLQISAQQSKDSFRASEEQLSSQQNLIESLTLEVQNISAKLESKEAAWNDLTNEYHSTTSSLGENIVSLSEKETALQRSLQQVIETKRELALAQQTIQQLQLSVQELESFKVQNKYAEERIELLDKELQQSRLETMSSKTSEDSYRLSVSRLESLVSEQQLFITELNNRLQQSEDYKSLCAEKDMQFVVSQDELARLQMEKENIEKECNRLRSHCDRLEEEKIQVKRDSDRYICEKASEVDRLKGQLEKSKSDNESMVSVIISIWLEFYFTQFIIFNFVYQQSEISIVQRRLELIKVENVKMKNDEQQWQRKVSLDSQTYVTQLNALKQSLEQAHQSHNTVSQHIADKEDTIRVLTRKLETRILELEEKNHFLAASAQDSKSRCVILENQVIQLQDTSLLESTAYRKLQESFNQQENEFKQYQDQTKDRIVDLQQRLDQQGGWLVQRESLLKETELALRTIQEDCSLSLAESSTKMSQLQSSNIRLQADVDRLEIEV
jgi:hypothetical protein